MFKDRPTNGTGKRMRLANRGRQKYAIVLSATLCTVPSISRAQNYLSAVQSYGAIAHYSFNEAAGSTNFADSITGVGTHVSATVTSGDSAYVTAGSTGMAGLGTGITFSGPSSITDILTIATGGVINSLPTAASYSLWFYQTSTGTRNELLFNAGSWSEEAFITYSSSLGYDDRAFTNQEAGYHALNSSQLPLNVWHNLTATRTSGGAATVYIDGSALSGTGTHTEQWFQGALSIGPANFSGFNGKMQAFTVFNQTLTPAQIANLISIAGIPPPPTPEPGVQTMLAGMAVACISILRRRRRIG